MRPIEQLSARGDATLCAQRAQPLGAPQPFDLDAHSFPNCHCTASREFENRRVYVFHCKRACRHGNVAVGISPCPREGLSPKLKIIPPATPSSALYTTKQLHLLFWSLRVQRRTSRTASRPCLSPPRRVLRRPGWKGGVSRGWLHPRCTPPPSKIAGCTAAAAPLGSVFPTAPR